MSRPAWAEIDLNAFQHNLQVVRRAAPTSRVVAIVKANGYGHGIICAAKALPDADAFGVASIDEAIQLREAGVKQRIVLLEGIFDADEMDLVVDHHLDLVLHNQTQIELLKNCTFISSTGVSSTIAPPTTITVWLKIDTGMHRLGVAPEETASVINQLQKLSFIKQPVILMTHLASADELDDLATVNQLECFNKTVCALDHSINQEKSIANSAAVLSWPESHVNWVRPGIMLYGISPFSGKVAGDFGLKPVMSVKSKLIEIRELVKGDTVGYGGQWVCDQNTRVGVIAFGYGDGYPRHAVNGTPVLLNNKKAPLIGRVSMDMMTIDLSGHKHANIGDKVELWGKNLPIEEVAQLSSTIAYELVCGITQRVKFVEN
ncbi:MAG: alanine racemase [Gammaproteobacteria bacterium]|nr:alanine racemase [Gammaproteobacteria bacterium]